LNRNASKLAFHFSGDAGLRYASNGFTGTEVCLQVPQNAADHTKIEMVDGGQDGEESPQIKPQRSGPSYRFGGKRLAR